MLYYTRTITSRQPQWTYAFSVKFFDHTQTHHTRQDSSGRVIGPSASGVIRTRNFSMRVSIDPRLRLRKNWDWANNNYVIKTRPYTLFVYFTLHYIYIFFNFHFGVFPLPHKHLILWLTALACTLQILFRRNGNSHSMRSASCVPGAWLVTSGVPDLCTI